MDENQKNMSENKDYVVAPSPAEEVVGAHAKPPRARVSDAPLPEEESAGEKLERKRDYLEGFLQQKPEGVSAGEPGGALYDAVIEALKESRSTSTTLASSTMSRWPRM